MKEKLSNWVAMPIRMFAFGDEGSFISKENDYAFSLYFLLGRESQHPWRLGRVETNIILLSSLLLMKNKKSENRSEIKRLLIVLHEKKYIQIYPSDDLISYDEMEYDTLITIHVPNAAQEKQQSIISYDGDRKYDHKGYVGVTQGQYLLCNGNARYFRAYIYAEWRMFRGQDNEGTYVLYNDEWQVVMDLSKGTILKLLKDLDEWNIIDKDRGNLITDVNGQIKREGSKFSPVSAEKHEEREKKAKDEEYSFEKAMNLEITARLDEFDGIDPRAEKSNLHKTGKDAWLTGDDWFIWKTTEHKGTKGAGDRRFNALKEKNLSKYNEIERQGKKKLKEHQQKEGTRRLADEISKMQISPDEIEHQVREVQFKKKNNGGVRDMSDLLD